VTDPADRDYDARALVTATAAAEFAHEYRIQRAMGHKPSHALNVRCMHHALTTGRAAADGLRGLEEGAETL
jgi:hypothetical protein